MSEKLRQANWGIHIGCVDGETSFSCISANKKIVRDFLRKHDHEGSTIHMEIFGKEQLMSTAEDDPEKIYAELDSE